MAQNPLRNKTSEEVIKFLEAHNFTRGKTHGDDTIFYSPKGKAVKITLNRKSTPIGTLYNIIYWSGISKRTWREWFDRERNFKGKKTGP